MFLLKLHIIQGEFGPEKAERSCLRLFPTQSCHARCWPVVCSSTPGAFEYCTGLGWMSPRPFCRCACQNGTEFRWTTCCARAPEMGAACCTRGQHAAPKPIKALGTSYTGCGQHASNACLGCVPLLLLIAGLRPFAFVDFGGSRLPAKIKFTSGGGFIIFGHSNRSNRGLRNFPWALSGVRADTPTAR